MNTHLRTKATTGAGGEPERIDNKRRHSKVQFGVPPTPHRIAAPVMRNFDHVRDNIRQHSQGIFNIPDQRASVPVESGSALPDLPPRADFARLSRLYLDSIHEWYPILHWPSFQLEVDEMYTGRTLEGMAREWIALFFAVLACGTLQTEPPQQGLNRSVLKGSSYFEIAIQNLAPWSQDVSLEHAQAAFLLSIYAAECNWISVGSMWLASAVRAAQELNVHCESHSGSTIDSEIRRRLWWALYARDR